MSDITDFLLGVYLFMKVAGVLFAACVIIALLVAGAWDAAKRGDR